LAVKSLPGPSGNADIAPSDPYLDLEVGLHRGKEGGERKWGREGRSPPLVVSSD